MQMIETISVLFVFFILIAIGLVFFARVQQWGAKSQIEEAMQKRAVNIVQKASFLPELRCSEENVEKDNCIDIEKAEAVGGSAGVFKENEDYYFDIFGYARIEIGYIYSTPAGKSFTNGILYNKQPDDWKDKIITPVPILLKDPIEKTFDFGIMNVTIYSK